MRASLIALIVITGASVISITPSRSEDRTPRRAHAESLTQNTASSQVAPLSQLLDQAPDGAQLIDLYKAARTVTDVEAANGIVKEEVRRAQSFETDLARLHAAKMAACEVLEASDLEGAVAKARAFSATLIRIDGELTKSLAAMRQKLATERSTSTRAKDDVNRFTVAALELGRLNLHTQELTGSIRDVARNVRAAAASCLPTPIPPLFADGGTPRRGVVSIGRSSPARRRPPAHVVARPVLFWHRF